MLEADSRAKNALEQEALTTSLNVLPPLFLLGPGPLPTFPSSLPPLALLALLILPKGCIVLAKEALRSHKRVSGAGRVSLRKDPHVVEIKCAEAFLGLLDSMLKIQAVPLQKSFGSRLDESELWHHLNTEAPVS